MNEFLIKLKYIYQRKKIVSPSNLIFHVTYRCNSSCHHCFNYKKLNQPNYRELNLVEIEKIAKSLGLMSTLSLSGGEPFLRSDLPEICHQFVKHNKINNIVLPTNGLLPEVIYQKVREILEKFYGELILIFSLDGTKEMHDYIRGTPGAFDKVLISYQKLAKLKKQFPNLNLRVNSCISQKNWQSLLKLAPFVKEQMPEISWHNFELIRGESKDPNLSPPSITDYQKFIKIIKNYWDQSQFFPTSRLRSYLGRKVKKFMLDLNVEILKQKRQVIKCYSPGHTYAVLYPDGEVKLCELLPSVGNVSEVNFDLLKLITSQKSQDQKKWILAGNCHCTHGCFPSSNCVLNPSVYLKILFSQDN